jgi:hypothetical protein|tara:strand:- start:409 stop:858 length:450 start_codon:yes stop_codon:yes gene_type:complete
MSGKTNPVSADVLNLFLNSATSPFGSTWVTLFTTNPTSDGTGSSYPDTYVEWGISGSRVRVYNDQLTDPYWTAPAVDSEPNKMEIHNSTTVGWTAIAGLSVGETVKGVGIFNAATGGNLLYWDMLTTERTVLNGDTYQFLAGTLQVRED